MGNSQSRQKQAGDQQHQRFGPVFITEVDDPQTGDKKSLMSFSQSVESQKVLNSWLQQISRIDDSESREILLIPQKHVFQKSGLCSSGGIVYLTYENFPFILDSEIKNRKKLTRYFLETEMWYLLYNIVRAGNKFEKIGKKVGDISPHNVIINDDGQIKVISTCSIPNELNNFQKVVEDIHAKVYLAPQQLNYDVIQKGEYPSNVDPCKAEVFSIGLTILASGILQDCQRVYKNEYKGLDEKLLNDFLNQFKQKYSNYLFSILVSMLAINPVNRRKASDIYNQLLPNEQKILNIEPFPEKNSYTNSRMQPGSSPYGQGQIVTYIMPQVQQIPVVRKTYQPMPNVYHQGYQPQH